jgi:hypothetical protein
MIQRSTQPKKQERLLGDATGITDSDGCFGLGRLEMNEWIHIDSDPNKTMSNGLY